MTKPRDFVIFIFVSRNGCSTSMQFSATTLFFSISIQYWVLIFGTDELDLFGIGYWKWKSVLVVGRARGGFPRVSRALENLCLWTEKSVIRDTNGVAVSEIAWIIFHTKRLLHFTSALRYLALGCAMSNCQLMTKDRRVCLQTGHIHKYMSTSVAQRLDLWALV